jgi:hypothetical protein
MANIGCSANAAIVWDFLTNKGLRDFQAAAVIGNLQQESGIDPKVPELEKGAHGIAQWHSPRWENLLAFDTDPWSLDTQLRFLWHELESDPSLGLTQLRASTTLEDATVIFQDHFERCGNCATNSRISAAQAALYACPSLQRPFHKRPSVFSVAIGLVGLVATAGYAAYEARKRVFV